MDSKSDNIYSNIDTELPNIPSKIIDRVKRELLKTREKLYLDQLYEEHKILLHRPKRKMGQKGVMSYKFYNYVSSSFVDGSF